MKQTVFLVVLVFLAPLWWACTDSFVCSETFLVPTTVACGSGVDCSSVECEAICIEDEGNPQAEITVEGDPSCDQDDMLCACPCKVCVNP